MTAGPGSDALRLTAGAVARGVDVAAWSGRTALGVVRAVPGAAGVLDALAARGDDALRAATELARAALRTVVREVVAAALLELDLTAIVRAHVDLDAVAEDIDVDRIAARLDVEAVVDRLDLDAIVDTVDLQRQIARVDVDAVAATLDIAAVADRVDVDAIAARLDMDAIIGRLDLIGLTNTIIDEVDLPQIIRDSTGSLSEEAVRGVRSQGMQADDAVAGFVGRLFGRERHNHGYPTDLGQASTENGESDR